MDYELILLKNRNGIRYGGVSNFFNVSSDEEAIRYAEDNLENDIEAYGYDLWLGDSDKRIATKVL